MRMTAAAIIAIIAMAQAPALLGAPGDSLRTNEVTLEWDAPPKEEAIEAWNLYWRTSTPPGMTLTNPAAGQPLLWTPPPAQASNNTWTLFARIANPPAPQAPVTNFTFAITWGPENTPAFFTMTKSNALGESFFSNVAWWPAAPNPRDQRLRLLSVR